MELNREHIIAPSYATITEPFRALKLRNTSLACWFWFPGCRLVELAYNSQSRKQERELRDGLNFLSRSHCWNLFTTQSIFVVTVRLQNLPPKSDFYYSRQSNRKHCTAEKKKKKNSFPKYWVIDVNCWREKYFGNLCIIHSKHDPLLSSADAVFSVGHGKSVLLLSVSLFYPLMGGLLSKFEKL